MTVETMWPTRAGRLAELSAEIQAFSNKRRALPGVASDKARTALATQIIASLRRLELTNIIKQRPIDPRRVDPLDPMFDPERAAILHLRNGDLDEAVWVTFLATHFGKSLKHNWKRLQDVYSGLGGERWTWAKVSEDPDSFRNWLGANASQIGGGFGNHRKYESLDGQSDQGTGAVVASYVSWTDPHHSHARLFGDLVKRAGNDPQKIFDQFYREMHVHRFGRLGKFDFLALLGRLDIAPIEPGSTYLRGATGPLRGARLLFADDPIATLPIADLEQWLVELGDVLGVGMQVMEDSLCNWQKSPLHFIHFRG